MTDYRPLSQQVVRTLEERREGLLLDARERLQGVLLDMLEHLDVNADGFEVRAKLLFERLDEFAGLWGEPSERWRMAMEDVRDFGRQFREGAEMIERVAAESLRRLEQAGRAGE